MARCLTNALSILISLQFSIKTGRSLKPIIWIEPREVYVELLKNTSVLVVSRNLPSRWRVNVRVDDDSIVHLVKSAVTLPAGNGRERVKMLAVSAGRTDLTIHYVHLIGDVYSHVLVAKNFYVDRIGDGIGWIYFTAWAVGCYPQIHLNWRRKSVVGRSFDSLLFYIIAVSCYCLYNGGLYFIPLVQNEYFAKHPRGVIPVEVDDLISSVQGVFVGFVQAVQCFIYERGGQKVSEVAKLTTGGIVLWCLVGVVLAVIEAFDWLVYLYTLSYVKLALSIIQYIPQVHFNYKRKSTDGFSIVSVFLDFTGGLFSIMQMFVLAYNYNDWTLIFGNFVKFGLGVISCMFSVVFIFQHYVLYKSRGIPSEILENESESEGSDLVCGSAVNT